MQLIDMLLSYSQIPKMCCLGGFLSIVTGKKNHTYHIPVLICKFLGFLLYYQYISLAILLISIDVTVYLLITLLLSKKTVQNRKEDIVHSPFTRFLLCD